MRRGNNIPLSVLLEPLLSNLRARCGASEQPPESGAVMCVHAGKPYQWRFRYILWITLLFVRPMASFLSSLGTGLLLTVALLIAYSYVQDWRRNPSRLPYPPGPKGYPIIGNLFDIPNAFIYKRFREMSRDLSTFHVLAHRSSTLTSLCL
jgi:hypothetical protein